MNREHIDRLVEALRAVVQTAIRKKLTPAEGEYAVTWWEPYSESGATARTEIRTAPDYRSVASMLLAEPSMEQLRSRAGEIRKIKWPEYLVDETAVTICDCYFSNLGSVALDECALRKIAEKYVTDVRSDEFDYATVIQVSHFSAAEPFKVDDKISFRPVCDLDIERFGYEPIPVRRRPRLNKRDWICTVTEKFREDDFEAPIRSREIWDRIIGALGLSNDGDAWFSLLCEGPTSPFMRGLIYGTEHLIHSAPCGSSVRLELKQIGRYRDMFRTINAIYDRNCRNLLAAFRRFRAAAGREVIDDKITDLAIGLESLLAPDSGTGEISYKFRMRGAALLPDRFGSPSDRLQMMNKLYKARCNIVHGSTSQESDHLSLMHRATDIFRIVFDELSRAPTTVKASIEQLDEEMTKGGERWLESYGRNTKE